MVTRRTDASRTSRATAKRDRRHAVLTGTRANTRAPAVPQTQHNDPDVEYDGNEDRIQLPDTRESRVLQRNKS
jgi:hypothetical protein